MSTTGTESEKGTEEQAPAVQHVDELLTETRTKMEAELEELRPSHEAFLRVEQILTNFDSITTGKARGQRKSNGSRAPRGSRSQEFLALVRAAGEEGIRVSDAAEQMDGINPNYLYRLAKELTEAGDVKKVDQRYIAITKADADADAEKDAEKDRDE